VIVQLSRRNVISMLHMVESVRPKVKSRGSSAWCSRHVFLDNTYWVADIMPQGVHLAPLL
jgi:hypothetical protein